MTDPIPDHSNRLAYGIALIFHPFTVAIFTLLIVLSEIPASERLGWTALIALVQFIPPILYNAWLNRQGKFAYQREVRGSLYLVGWVCILISFILTLVFQGPYVLTACIAALVIWVPLQSWVNQRFTKVSIHVAVATGCLVGLLLLGHLNSWWLQGLAIVIIVITAWARMTTKNHTLQQVVLGVMTGAVPVLLTFPIVLR